MSKKIILSHSGKQHSYHVAKALSDLGYLKKFYTSSYIRSARLQKQLIRLGDTFWTRRFLEGLGGELVVSNWRFELKEFIYNRLFGNGFRTQMAIYQRDVLFDRFISQQVHQFAGRAFWGFQGSCNDSLLAAKNAGKYTVCELTTAHVTSAQRMLGEEQKLHPEWADSFDNLIFPVQYQRRLEEEPFLADKVVAASKFTKQSLLDAGLSSDKIYHLPLGFDAGSIPFDQHSFSPYKDRPLKLLYVGRITQRKGIKYLLEAVKQYSRKDVELFIIGNKHGRGEGLKYYKGLFQLHPSLAQSKVFNSYREYDALVLPSVFEGFGLVIVEAMAAGLPVITTPHTIGPDIIEEDQNGYLVPIRDVNAIQESIDKLANKRPEALLNMRINARNSAMKFTWDAYRDRLKEFLETISMV